MSIRIYLKESIAQDPSFNKAPLREDATVFEKIHIERQDDQWYLQLASFEDRVPESIKTFADGVSVRIDFSSSLVARAVGTFKAEGVTAELDLHGEVYCLSMRGDLNSLPAMHELYRAIRAGTAVPDESWEGAQLARPRADLEKDLAEAEAKVRRLAYERDCYLKSTSEAKITLYSMAQWLNKLPLLNRSFFKRLRDAANEALGKIDEMRPRVITPDDTSLSIEQVSQ